jgi:cell division septal protein FtsQ
MNSRFNDLRSEMNSRFEAIDKRFDILQWMLGLFITIALVILGFVLRMQWQMQRRQTQMETTLETHKDEIYSPFFFSPDFDLN